MLSFWETNYDKPRQHIQKQRHFANESLSSQSFGFPSSHVWMWELDSKETWALKNWCFWTVVLEKTLESTLDCKKIQPVNLKGNHSWIFIARTDAEAETPILWPSDVNNWLICKDTDAGTDLRQEEKETTEDEMIGYHHQLSGHEFKQDPGVSDGQGGLACCTSWGRKESDMTEQLNWIVLVAQRVKNLPAMQETWVQSLGWEDPLEESMATRSSIHSCLENPHEQRRLVGYSPWGPQSQTWLSD